jgi:hypothetical protein
MIDRPGAVDIDKLVVSAGVQHAVIVGMGFDQRRLRDAHRLSPNNTASAAAS